jgi:hypothetical protein
MFYVAEPIFGGTEGVESRFHVLLSRTHLQWYLGRQVPFSCFVLSDSFSSVPTASGPVFMFCALGLIFDSLESVVSHFHVLSCRTRFLRCRWRRVSFSCFAFPISFSTISRASSPVFMFCAPELIFGGTVGLGSRFHVLRSRTRFRDIEGVGSIFHVLYSRTHFRR